MQKTLRSQPLIRAKIIHWTDHARFKMRFYGLSEARVKRIIHTPKRIEEGIAPHTVAMMQVSGSTKHPYELWVMFQDKRGKRNIISAWRYPGKSKPRDEITKDFLRSEFKEYEATA